MRFQMTALASCSSLPPLPPMRKLVDVNYGDSVDLNPSPACTRRASRRSRMLRRGELVLYCDANTKSTGNDSPYDCRTCKLPRY